MRMRFALALLCVYLGTVGSIEECPKKCTCRGTQPPKDGVHSLKIRCGELVPISHLEELDLLTFAGQISQLNLTHNLLATFDPQVQLLALQKLDLSKNLLSALVDNQFIHVPNVKRLDISANAIKSIEPLAFAGLKHLERLKLNHNQITTIEKGTFKPLMGLKQLDISSNPLVCECALLWLPTFAQAHTVKLLSNPKCLTPSALKGTALKKLRIDVDFHCTAPAQPPHPSTIHIVPAENQVVFAGDSLQLRCETMVAGDHLEKNHFRWHFLEMDVDVFGNVAIETAVATETGSLISTLTLVGIYANQSGIWSCQLNANASKGVDVIVISNTTRYCAMATAHTSRGTYTWPRTIVNRTVALACTHVRGDTHVEQQQLRRARFFCSAEGKWAGLDVSECAYVSEHTRILDQLANVDLALEANVVESMVRVRNYTSDLRAYADPLDVELTVRTLEKYVARVGGERALATLSMEVLSGLMTLHADYLGRGNVSRRIVSMVEEIARAAGVPVAHQPNVAAEEFTVKPEVFTGITCTWYLNQSNTTDRLFYCLTSNKSALPLVQNRIVEASLQVPASLLYQIREPNVTVRGGIQQQRLLVTMFSTGKLFPLEGVAGDVQLSAAVVGVDLVNVTITELTEPIYVMLRTPPRTTYAAALYTPAWWNATAHNWSTHHCAHSHERDATIVFHCSRLGHYTLLPRHPNAATHTPHAHHTSHHFPHPHPAIYLGNAVLTLLLLIAILTHTTHRAHIQMPRTTKHTLINTWLAILLLTILHTVGLYRTEAVLVCRVIGLLLHYTTLTPLFWMCVGAITMFKRVNKSSARALHVDDDDDDDDVLPADAPLQKPILGLYLVGWGIAMIICGLSAAINMKQYATHARCFLHAVPAYSALFVPALALIVIILVAFLCIRCHLEAADVSGHLSEGTQATENVDLDLLDVAAPPTEHHSVRSSASTKTAAEEEDAERGAATQLNAHVITLVLYVGAWCACALATVQPLGESWERLGASALYALLAVCLGAFQLFFYCVARHDVRTQWCAWCAQWLRVRGCRSRTIADTINARAPLQMAATSNGAAPELRVTSRSSSRSSRSHNGNGVRAHSSDGGACAVKVNNANLIRMHRQQYRGKMAPSEGDDAQTTSAHTFYNPYQSTVARKFFRRQRQNMMKRNNLPVRRCGGGASDSSSRQGGGASVLFGTNAKVNNTNIHVERVFKGKRMDPNVLEEEEQQQQQQRGVELVPIEKLMMNADRLRRREAGRHRTKKRQNVAQAQTPALMMRTVSQQCSLEYSSDSVSLAEGKSNVREEKEAGPRAGGRVFVNPAHGLVRLPGRRGQSRASSVSASELDELYQQIRKGPPTASRRDLQVACVMGARLSDPEIRFSGMRGRGIEDDGEVETNV